MTSQSEAVLNREMAYREMNESAAKKAVGEPRNPSGFRPLGRAVIVEPVEAPKKAPSAIIIPDKVQDRMMMVEQRARVIECGPLWVKDEPEPRCKAGDLVMIARMAGYVISGSDSADGKQYRVVNHMDIFLAVEEGV